MPTAIYLGSGGPAAHQPLRRHVGKRFRVLRLGAISVCGEISRQRLSRVLDETSRPGDHHGYVGDVTAPRTDSLKWDLTRRIGDILEEVNASNAQRLLAAS